MQRVDYVIMGAVALILLFGGLLFLPGGPSELTINNGYADGCTKLKMKYSCDQFAVTKISALTLGNTLYSLGNLCASKGYDNTLTCARSCGCNINGTGLALAAQPRIVYSDNPIIDGTVTDPEETIEELPEETGEEYYEV